MNTENLLRRMGRMKREEAEPDEPCLSRERLEALRAGRMADPEREAAERHLAACERCVDHLLTLDAGTPTVSPGTLRRVLAATEPERARQKSLVPGWAAGALAAAAALLLVVLVNRPQVADVPPYGLTLAGQVEAARGADDPASREPRVYLPDSDIVLRASPLQGNPAQLPAAVAYLRQPDGTLRPFEPAPEVERDALTGLIELRVRAGALLGDRFGRHEVRLVLLPEGMSAPAELKDSSELEARGAEVLEASLEYRPGRS